MKKKSFTLVEIMIVVAIIAILAAIAVPNLSKNRETAMNQTKTSNIKLVNGAIANYLAANPQEARSDITEISDLSAYLETTNMNVGGETLTVSASDVYYE